MSELKTNLEQILQEKTTKLIPENIKRKVEIFDVTGTDGDAEVEELQTKIIETRQEIADTRRDLENSATTVTGTGENVTLNQTAEATFKKLGVSGNSKQTQYTGKNLFKPIPSATRNGITFMNNEDGSYTLNGTATAPTSFYIVNVGYRSGTYALSANNPVTNNDVILQLETSNGNKNTALNAINKTLIDNCDDINALSIIVSNGTTLSNFVIKPQLELGSSVTDFEPYTGGIPSPNPSYPQEITNVTGDVEVVVENKNIINITNEVNVTNQGVVITGDEEKQVIKFKGTISNTYCQSDILPLKKPISTGIFRANFKSTCDAFIVLVGENTTWLKNMQSSASSSIVVDISTLSEPVIALKFGIEHFTSGANVDYEVGYQLTKGSELSSYISHQHQTFTFPLGNEKLMLGDYLADDGIHHVRGQVVYDGTEEIFANTSSGDIYAYIVPTSNKKRNANVLSNYFKQILEYNSAVGIYSGAGLNICIKDITNVNDFKTWLSTHNTIVEYELAEEVIVPYTEEQQQVYNEMKKVISYEGQTNVIGSSGGSNPIFTVTAFRDADLAIASLDNRVTLLED